MNIKGVTRSDAHPFGQLRARIETTFADAALIVITSANRGDGKSVTAFGLAAALAEADYRVLFIDANAEAPLLPRSFIVPAFGTDREFVNICKFAKQIPGQRFSALSFADKSFEIGMSMEKAKAAAVEMRSNYDYIIMDMSPVLESDLAVLFSALSDGTLLTLRLGRFPSGADAETMKSLTRAGANMIGVLSVTQKMIKEFAQKREELVLQPLVPARRVTSRHTLDREPIEDIGDAKPSNAVR